MSDLTLGQLVTVASQLPATVVQEETVLSNLLKPVYAGVAALKNGPLDQKADALGQQLYKLEVQLNTYAQDVANVANAVSVYMALIGGFSLPGSGIVVDTVSALIADANKFVAAAEASPNLVTVKGYLTQFLAATQQLITLVPTIGTYAVDGVTVSQVLVGLEEIAAAI